MRDSRNLSKFALAGLLILGLGHKCFADSILFSNLGSAPTPVYNDQYIDSWAILGEAIPMGPAFQGLETYGQAQTFTPTSAAYFTQLDLGLAFPGGPTSDPLSNSVTVDLMSNSGGPPEFEESGGHPGTVLESWNVSGLPKVGTCCPLTVLSGNGSILLSAGTPYWVAVLPGNDISYAAWDSSPYPQFPSNFQSIVSVGGDYGDFYQYAVLGGPEGAYDVQGVATTPEPGTLSLLATGLLGLAGLMRRRIRRPAI